MVSLPKMVNDSSYLLTKVTMTKMLISIYKPELLGKRNENQLRV